MADNIDLFEEEIDEIREYSELDMEAFYNVLECTREVVTELGDSVSPVSVVDIIEGAVGNLIYNPNEQVITVEEAVERAVNNLHLVDEIDDMFCEDGYIPCDEIDTGKVKQ